MRKYPMANKTRDLNSDSESQNPEKLNMVEMNQFVQILSSIVRIISDLIAVHLNAILPPISP